MRWPPSDASVRVIVAVIKETQASDLPLVMAAGLGRNLQTKPLPADAGRFGAVLLDILKYDVVGNVAACGAKIPVVPENHIDRRTPGISDRGWIASWVCMQSSFSPFFQCSATTGRRHQPTNG